MGVCSVSPEKPFLSDTDFEKLKADVLAGGASVSLSPPSVVSQPISSAGAVVMGQPGGVVMGGPNNNFAPPSSLHPVTMGSAPFKVHSPSLHPPPTASDQTDSNCRISILRQ